jgi:thymidine phosphorylase
MKSDELKLGDYSYQFAADKNGQIAFIDNHEIEAVCRALGTPFVKQSGMYFSKSVGETVRKGEVLVTIYAQSMERLELGRQAMHLDRLFVY